MFRRASRTAQITLADEVIPVDLTRMRMSDHVMDSNCLSFSRTYSTLSRVGADVDYAQIVKSYAPENAGRGRYSPPAVVGVEKAEIAGRPNWFKVCTSYVERHNLTIRMQLRRFTRLTNGFSRKLANLKAMVALYICYFNFRRIHSSLRVTPAMAAGVTDRVWKLGELLA